MEECGLDPSGSRYGPVVDSCEHGNEPSDYINGGESLDQLNVLSASQEGLCSMEIVMPTLRQCRVLGYENCFWTMVL
jgi:hypothetical protein